MMDKYHPGYFGKVGMRHFHKLKNHYVRPVINLDKVWTLIGEEKREACAKDTSKAPCIDLTDFGIFKLLGKGQLPNQPIVIKCRYVSKLAERRSRRLAVPCSWWQKQTARKSIINTYLLANIKTLKV